MNVRNSNSEAAIAQTKKIFFGAALLFLTSNIMAQKIKEFLSAKESETSNFGWMQGFPPPPEKVLHTWDGSFF